MVTNIMCYLEADDSEIKCYALAGKRCLNSPECCSFILEMREIHTLRVYPRTPSPFSFISACSYFALTACAPLVT